HRGRSVSADAQRKPPAPPPDEGPGRGHHSGGRTRAQGSRSARIDISATRYPRNVKRTIPLALVVLAGTLFAFHKPFREYPGMEYSVGSIPPPPGWNQETDFVFGRIMFPGGPLDGYRGREDPDYHRGRSLWTQDYPRADRHFLEAVKRLTRVDARPVEQIVDMEDGNDVYNYPFIYAVQ